MDGSGPRPRSEAFTAEEPGSYFGKVIHSFELKAKRTCFYNRAHLTVKQVTSTFDPRVDVNHFMRHRVFSELEQRRADSSSDFKTDSPKSLKSFIRTGQFLLPGSSSPGKSLTGTQLPPERRKRFHVLN